MDKTEWKKRWITSNEIIKAMENDLEQWKLLNKLLKEKAGTESDK